MKNFITIVDNAFSDTLCEELIEYWNKHEDNMVLRDYFDSQAEVNNVRTKELLLDSVNPEEKYFIEKIQSSFQKVVNKYTAEVGTFTAHIDQGLSLRRIHGATRNHTDGLYCADGSGKKFERKLSVIVGLNSDFEGGEFDFPFQDFKYTLRKGQAICFPPYYTHPHSVSEPTNGTYRYTINTWLLEVPDGHSTSVHP